MKLLNKTILYYLVLIVPLLVLAGAFSFSAINRAVQDSADETLWNEKRKAESLINAFKVDQTTYLSFDSLSSIKIDTNGNTGYKFSNIYRMMAGDDEQANHRMLKSYYKSKGVNYLITIVKPTVEEDDLIENLMQTILLISGFFLLAFFVVNWFVSRKLWKPFYKTIQQLNAFDIRSSETLKLENTSTKEFQQLNTTVLQMTDKMQRDFISQKEFTENASHEIQTPLAVIISRLENLIQTEGLNEQHFSAIQAVYEASIRLSKLNNSLLLLTKIDNNQFIQKETVDLKSIIEKQILLYEDVIKERGIKLSMNLEAVKISINPFLAETLISNLIGNAIKHNVQNGDIRITLVLNELSISNTGSYNTLDTAALFTRFKKGNPASESLGLGLSIIKKIAGSNNMVINYKIKEKKHIISLQF